MPCRGPDRVPVPDALGVVPHPVGVHEARARGLRRSRASGRRRGRARPRSCGAAARPRRSGQLRRTSSWLAPMPPEVTTTACARSSKSPTTSRELASPRARALGSSTSPATPSTAPPVESQPVDAVAEAQLDQPAALGLAHAPDERLEQARAGAPGDVEARDGVAGPGRQVAAALGPAHVGQEAHALLVQPRALLARGEVDVGLGPAARPVVLGPVEAGRAEPVLPGQFARVADAASAAARGSRRRTARRTTRTPARRATPRAPGRRGSTRRPASASSAVATRPARPAPDDDDVGVHARSMPHRRTRPRPTPRAWHPAPMAGTEIERKFLADGVPAGVAWDAGERLRQGYLALDGDTEVRLRLRGDGAAVLTLKRGGGRLRARRSSTSARSRPSRLWAADRGPPRGEGAPPRRRRRRDGRARRLRRATSTASSSPRSSSPTRPRRTPGRRRRGSPARSPTTPPTRTARWPSTAARPPSPCPRPRDGATPPARARPSWTPPSASSPRAGSTA